MFVRYKDLLNAEESPERYWRGPRSQEVVVVVVELGVGGGFGGGGGGGGVGGIVSGCIGWYYIARFQTCLASVFFAIWPLLHPLLSLRCWGSSKAGTRFTASSSGWSCVRYPLPQSLLLPAG